jgi:hypothetical protein
MRSESHIAATAIKSPENRLVLRLPVIASAGAVTL